MIKTIKKAEADMLKILKSDMHSWTKFYLILKQVEEEELYKPTYKSFTQWVKNFCLTNKISESIVWSRKTAGKVYERYKETKEKEGVEVPAIENANVSVDSLVLLDKITRSNQELGAELAEKAINKELKRKDLRNAYESVRKAPNDIKVVQDVVSLKKDENKEKSEEEKAEELKDNITAAKIVTALSNASWLGKPQKKKAFTKAEDIQKYRAITEFPVFTGTTRKSRRVDVVVAENITLSTTYQLNLHGIEIKVSKSDLNKDKKFIEYAEFVNYLWIAVPEELVEDANNIVPENLGILVLKDGNIIVTREAKKGNPVMLEESLTTLAIRLL